MTAVKYVQAVTRSERQAAEAREWIADAVGYMIMIGLYEQKEIYDAVDLAENLHYHSRDEGGEIMYSAKEAVDEELTYWGD
ncbi:hypothetical protein [Pseudomonas phage COT4]|uniref:Uncharacterized protein n=1 Tax=Pseudomonas phage M5.1 TaxID=2873460 RepID=A0AAE8XI42_9CAUD|nr:hypothetical protein QGX13_gp008 [Pseudomonas phage M5.1]UAV89609.1 hypothetical protein M51_8 [Pseudomonas phage M5.1]UGL61209.1 hypothetical protein [Pseudomonas phage COT4]